MSARSASGLRPPGLAETVRIRVFCPFNEKKLTSFPNERRKAREKYLYFPMQEIELYCTCLMLEMYGDMVQRDDCESCITCDALDWWSKWTGFVGLKLYITI